MTMQLTREASGGRYTVTHYREGGITVDEVEHTRSLVLTPDHILPDWGPRAVDELTEAHLQSLLELVPDIVLLGTGPRIVFPPAEQMVLFQRRGIGIEVMDTAAACRTFNILAGDERKVVGVFLQ